MFAFREFNTAVDVRPIIVPVDLHTGANTGLFQPVRNFARVAFIYHAAAGTAGQDVTLTLRQATTAAGGSAKDLVAIRKVYSTEHATTLPDNFTVIEQTAAATFVSATGGECIELAVFELDPADLDVANGFDFVSVNIADPGAGTAKEGCVIMLGLRARYASNLPGAAA